MVTVTAEEIEKLIGASYELPNRVLDAVPEPLVTVRTSAYNHVRYIEQCILGVLSQKTNFQFEYIIGEDFSTDGTREIVFDLAGKYPEIIRVITADFNVRQKANGKRCIEAARGKYIATCDGDDYWTDPLKLQKQFDFMEANPAYAMCYHSYRVKSNGIISKKLYPVRGRDFTGDQLVASPDGIAASTKFLRHVFRMDREQFLAMPSGDYFFNAFIGTFGACKFLPDIEPSIRTIHDGGVWSSLNERSRLFGAINTKLHIYKYFQEKRDDRRALLALSALQDMIQEILPEIDPKRRQFVWNASRLRINIRGIQIELFYKPLIQKMVMTIKRFIR